MGRPEEFKIIKEDDIVFFYDLVMKHRNQSIKGRKSIESISKKYGIEIKREKSGECKDLKPELGKIILYDDNLGLNQCLFLHLRNAFAHCYIEVSEERCRFLDWNAFIEKKKCTFGKNRITLLGNVNYENFKKMMDEFFSPSQK